MNGFAHNAITNSIKLVLTIGIKQKIPVRFVEVIYNN